jgi:hypothetical protein
MSYQLSLLGRPLCCLPMLFVAIACQSSSQESSAPSPTGASSQASNTELFGEPLGASPEVSLAELLSAPGAHADQPVRVAGHVRRACSNKGCWMELATGPDANAAACRVTFKDYGFFVPTDSAGSDARVEGMVTLKRVPPAQVRHYENEGATFASKHEDGSADEVRLVATGVELRR